MMVKIYHCVLVTSCLMWSTTRCDDDTDTDVANKSPANKLVPAIYYNETDTVRLVQVLFRHGDRSPTRTYVNDIYKEADWPQGYGQLSTTGMMQENQLGKYLRDLYVDTLHLLNAEYTRPEIHARSTDLDRAIMSCYSMLSGLYPPAPGTSWHPGIGWQPIPVHNMPGEEDYLLMTEAPCPVFGNATHSISPATKAVMEKHKDFFQYVSNHSGEPNTWGGVRTVLDPIFCQKTSNYTMPTWVTEEIWQELLEMRDISTQFWIPEGHAFLKAGVLLKEMINNMVNVSQRVVSVTEKLFIYSAHDTNVIALLSTMGVFNNRQPPYTACVLMELLESQQHEFSVRLWYRNDTSRPPYLLTLDRCSNKTKCPLKEFVHLFQSSLPVDIERECGLDSDGHSTGIFSSEEFTTSSTIVNVGLLFTVLMMVIFNMTVMLRMRDPKRDSHDYMAVPTDMAMSDLSSSTSDDLTLSS